MNETERMPDWARRALWLGAALVLLVAAFYILENRRGAQAWQRAEEAYRVAGESLDLASLLPGPVPDSENYAANAVLKDIADSAQDYPFRAAPGGLQSRLEEIRRRLFYGVDRPIGTSPEECRRTDLNAWQDSYAETDPPLLETRSEDPAQDVLTVLNEFADVYLPLEGGLELPHARFTPDLRVRIDTLEELPNRNHAYGSPLMRLSEALMLRAEALLAMGRSEEALRSMLALLRISEAMGAESSMITLMRQGFLLAMSRAAVWNALESRSFSQDQLTTLQTRLAKLPLQSQALTTLRFESLSNVHHIRLLQQHHGAAEVIWYSPSGVDIENNLKRVIRAGLSRLIPPGWVEQNRAAMASCFLECFIQPFKLGDLRDFHQRLEDLDRSISNRGTGFPYSSVLSSFAGMHRLFGFVAYSLVMHDLMIAACALERYALEHGTYPSSLSGLTPQYIAEVPLDPMAKQPLRYQRTSDGRYRIYSIGLNGVDDGGKPGSRRSYRGYETNGDWVWQYSLDAEALEDEAP